MFRQRKRSLGTALIVLVMMVVAAACSATGGKRAADAAANAAAGAGSAGHANTPRYTFDVITHAEPGDTFWDIIRSGASAAASKDNISYHYSSDADPTKQAQLITDAINSQSGRDRGDRPGPAGAVPDDQEGRGGQDPGGHVQRGHQQLAVVRGTVILRLGRDRGRDGGR